MRRFLIVYTFGVVGALGGAALGPAVLQPTPMPGPGECGMRVLPGLFLGGAVGAALMTWLGLRLTRAAGVQPPTRQREPGAAESGVEGNMQADRPGR